MRSNCFSYAVSSSEMASLVTRAGFLRGGGGGGGGGGTRFLLLRVGGGAGGDGTRFFGGGARLGLGLGLGLSLGRGRGRSRAALARAFLRRAILDSLAFLAFGDASYGALGSDGPNGPFWFCSRERTPNYCKLDELLALTGSPE